jgi:hypothetical protein
MIALDGRNDNGRSVGNAHDRANLADGNRLTAAEASCCQCLQSMAAFGVTERRRIVNRRTALQSFLYVGGLVAFEGAAMAQD